MKILYVAGNTTKEELLLQKEMTEFVRAFSRASGQPVEFVPLPHLTIDRLVSELTLHAPDILHISAHGENDYLHLADGLGNKVKVSANLLRAHLTVERPPRLVYLNACDSQTIAQALVEVVDFAIGTTAPITNYAARTSALLFYERVLTGSSVQAAFDVAQETLKGIDTTSTVLKTAKGVNPKRTILHYVPRLIARFADDDYAPNKHGEFTIETGLLGCPANTTQVVFFTDDREFIREEGYDFESDGSGLAYYLCRVVQDMPAETIIWDPETEDLGENYRLFATATTPNGLISSAAGTLCGALSDYYRLLHPAGEPPPEARNAIARLKGEVRAGGNRKGSKSSRGGS